MSARGVRRRDAEFRLLSALAGNDFGKHAACSDEDPELFFPDGDAPGQIEEAKQVCRGCPIQGSCLRRAMQTGEQGIWGGTTDAEREQMAAWRLVPASELPVTRDPAPAAPRLPGVAA